MKHVFCGKALMLGLLFCVSVAGYTQVSLTATSGTTTGTYTTLKGAFDKINDGTHKGDIVIKINSSTTETASASLNESAAASTSAPYFTSINIYPTTTGLSISGNLAAPLINLNGADNVTIDGRVNATGSTKSLTITNTSALSTAGTSTIRFINDATTNTVKYCTLKGSSTDASAGVVFFSTTTGTTGNDNNTIDNNDITNAADGSRPLNAVYALGTSAKSNSSNTISNNNIYDFLSTSATSQGINIGSENSFFTISVNSFYETASPSFAVTSSTAAYNVILINATATGNNGFTVSGNYIGGRSAQCGGSAWTKTGQNNSFTAISVNTASTALSGSLSSIQGNTIQNISWTNTGAAAFTGISLSGVTVANIGTVTGNTIGASTGTGSILYTAGATGANVYGISIGSTEVVDCRNNTIGAISAANASTNATNFFGIVKTATAGTTTISGNTIGSTATASSINASSASSTSGNAQSVFGIQSAGSGTVTISENTVANLVNATSNSTAGTKGIVSGIYVSGGTNTISGNTVRNLSNANADTSVSFNASVSGIVMVNYTAAAQTVSGNTVHSLSNSFSTFAGGVIGIYYSGPTTASMVSRNFIHSLSVTGASSTTADLYGIRVDAGAATYHNNIVSLGGNTTTDVFGIYQTGAASNNNNLYFNTVYLSGSLASGATNPSYALFSTGTANSRDYRNNVLVNARSTTSGSNLHYAMYIAASGGTLNCNYNNYFVSGTGGVLGYFGAIKTTAAIVSGQTGNDANSISTNPTFSAMGTTADDYTPTVRGTGVAISGITVDYAGVTRGSSVSMGAIEISGVPPQITSFSPASAKPGDAVTLSGSRFNATAANNVVFFGATRGTVTAATATSVTVTVPVGATYAPITLLNTGTVMSCSSLSNFNPVYEPAKSTIAARDFAAQVDFTTGPMPLSVAIGDLDGDGKPDLASANLVTGIGAGTVSVFRNTSASGSIASSSFAAKVDFTTGLEPRHFAIGDLDGDGRPELVVGYGSNRNFVSVFLNTSTSGTVSFASKVDFTTGAGPISVAIGDLDGDGKADLAVANFNSNSVSVLRNTSTSGAVSFATKVDFTTGSSPISVAIGDLDGDGKSDLAVGYLTPLTSLNTVSVLRNISARGAIYANSFAAKVDFAAGYGSSSVAIGDLDGDGKSDLAVTNRNSNSVSVFRNTSSSGSITSGSFAAKVDITTGLSPTSVAIGDLDGNGRPDLAVAAGGFVSVLRNTSTSGSITSGSFETKVDITGSGGGSDVGNHRVLIGDLDGDGRSDLAVVGFGSNRISVIRNVSCLNPTSGGTIAEAQSGNAPFDPAAFTSSAAASGHYSTLEYKWQSSITSASAGFSDIASSNSATYDAGALTQTTWFKRLARVSCQSDWTDASESNVLQVQVVYPPDAPTDLTAIAGVNSTTISFTAPGSVSGVPITNYEYTTNDGLSWTAFSPAQSASPVYISGLTACTAYTIRIRAVNSAGSGTASASVSVTPRNGQAGDIDWTARSAAAANGWYSVIYGNGLYVAVSADGTNRVMTSPDGISWTARSAAAANQWYSVTYGNGLFVAVGIDGANQVMTSPDGINWTARSAPEANFWISVTYGNGLFVAVSPFATNPVMTSPDGINWTARSAAGTDFWTSVTYGNGLFVAVALGTNRVMTSPDGITWTARSAAAANQWRSVTYGNGLFVAVAADGTNPVMTSPDGITWTARSAESNGWFSVTYGNGLFVAVAAGGTNRVMTSLDGITWTARSAAEANSWYSVTYGNGRFVAVAASGTNRVMTYSQSLLAPDKPVIGSITPAATSIEVAFTAPGDAGGSAITNYEYSTNNGTNWTTLSPASTTSPLTISGLTQGTAYQVQLRAVNTQGSGCTSAVVNTTTTSSCNNPTSGGTIAAAQSGNSPFDPVAFTSSVAASGHTGTLEYKWQSSTTSNSSGFSDVTGATSATYDPGALTQTTWFKRVARVSCQSNWTGAAESNVLEVTVNSSYTWTGSASNDWSTPSNWTPSSVPSGNASVIIPAGLTNYPVPPSTVTLSSLSLQGGIFAMGTSILTLTGNLTNNGTITSTTGKLTMSGSTVQTISGTGTIRNLEVDNAAGVVVFAGNHRQSITGAFFPTAGTLTTNGNLTLKSSSAGTARVATGSASGGYIDGEVTVERYLPAGRKWRFLTAPLKGTSNTSVFYNWQNNDVPNGATGVEIWGPLGTSNPSSTNNGLAQGANASMRSFVNGAWSPVTNTNETHLFDGTTNNAFALFQTGPYNNGSASFIGSTGNLPAGVPTTLSATGGLITGDHTKSFTATSAGQYFLVANPYASPVDPYSFATAGNTTNLGTTLHMWDAKPGDGNGLGRYVSFNLSVPGGAYSNTAGGFASGTPIQSGQAFFVQAVNTGAASLVFRESAKGETSSHSMLGDAAGERPPSLSLQLWQDSVNYDGAVAFFHEGASGGLDAMDGAKLPNGSDNLGLRREGRTLVFEHRPVLKGTDTLFLHLGQMRQMPFRLRLSGEGFDPAWGVAARLVDRFTGRETALDLQGATDHAFTVTADTLSTGGRFMVVLNGRTAMAGSTAEPVDGGGMMNPYPNPVTGGTPLRVRIDASRAPWGMTLLDGTGREVWSRKGIEGAVRVVEIDMSRMSVGVYRLVMTDAKGVRTVSQVVKR